MTVKKVLTQRAGVGELVPLGAEVAPGSPADLDAYMKRQLDAWGRKSSSAIMRATMSLALPGSKAVTMRTGFDGHSCAATGNVKEPGIQPE